MIITKPRTLTVFSKCYPCLRSLLCNVIGVHSNTVRNYLTSRMAPNTEAHLRYMPQTDLFKIIFRYIDPKTSANRECVIQRSLNEPVNNLVSRISMKVNSNIIKEAQKEQKSTDDLLSLLIPVEFIRNGQPVSDDVRCRDVFRDFGKADVSLKIGDVCFDILVNHPWILKLTLPKSIMVGFGVYPAKFDNCYADRNESEFLWYRDDGSELIGSGFVYVPTVDDIGSKLKLICTPGGRGVKGYPVETKSACCVEAAPGRCPFEDRHAFTPTHLSADSFRVVSYNILCDLYSSSAGGREIFSYCPPYALKMDYRKQLLLKELMGYNADLICLQEVDCGIFQRDLTEVLGSIDMGGLLAKKGGQVNEGVACFYRKSRFELISSRRIILSEGCCTEPCLQDIRKIIAKNEVLCTQLQDRTTVLQLVVLRYVDKPNHKLVVANTHLFFKPDADNIRLLQSGMSINLINDMVTQLKSEDPTSVISVIFCGDFNSTPECGVYQLMTANHVPENHKEWTNGDETIDNLSLNNPFKLESACGTPEYTNYTPSFKACLDYIFYQADVLEVEQVIPLPSEEEVSRYNAIPSPIFPSDHIALVADLKWR